MATVAVLGTLDTKGEEHGFVAQRIRERGHAVLVIDVGTLHEPKIKPDISRDEVLLAAGVSYRELRSKEDRGESVRLMSIGA